VYQKVLEDFLRNSAMRERLRLHHTHIFEPKVYDELGYEFRLRLSFLCSETHGPFVMAYSKVDRFVRVPEHV